MKPLRLILLLALYVLTGGCTIINFYDKGVKVSRYVGLPIYFLEPNQGAIYFDVTGFGLVSSPGGVSLGYVQQAYAQVPAGTCSLVIFSNSQTQSEEWVAYLQKINVDPGKICLTHNRN